MRFTPAFAALALLPAASLADTCPWIGEDVAAQVILAKPAYAKAERDTPIPNSTGVVATTTCRFKAAGEVSAQLSVIVIDLGNEGNAKARYEGELRSQGSRAKPAKIDGHPAFFTMNRGFSGATFALKGRQVVFVSHVFSKKVNEAIRRDPDGSVLSTHEIARQVLAKL